MDKETLAAFVDGELTPEKAAKVVMHLADNAQDQAYVDDLLAANEALGLAFGDAMYEPVPDLIRAAVMGDVSTTHVLPFRAAPRRPVWQAGLALAASIGLVAVILTNTTSPDAVDQLALGPVPDDGGLAIAFQTLASGQQVMQSDGASMTLLASVQLGDGQYCREFEQINGAATELHIGLACKPAGAPWEIRVVASEPLAGDDTGDEFVVAGGREAGLLDAFLDKYNAGQAMSPQQEAVALARGWED